MRADLAITVKTTEYAASSCFCPRCNKHIPAAFPEGVSNEGNYGNNVRSVATYLVNCCNVSKGNTARFLHTASGGELKLSTGSIQNFIASFSKMASGEIKDIAAAIKAAPVVGSDATHTRSEGAKSYIYTYNTPDAVLFQASGHKGKAPLDVSVIAEYEGIESPKRDLVGHTYIDFLALDEEVRLSAFEMDCVEGIRSDVRVILTFLLKRFHFQFGILLDRHDTASVIAAFDWLESICDGRFSEIFSTILTDRGHEFAGIDGMEFNDKRKKRCSVYFCDPYTPSQKGQCEKSHVEVRKVIPKGTSFENLTAYDMATLFSHINSVPRKSLGGASPLALAQSVLPKSLLEGLGLSIVMSVDIMLKPSLLDKTEPAE